MIGIELVLLARIARSVGHELVELREHLGLQRLVLDDRLDHELAIGQVGRGRS